MSDDDFLAWLEVDQAARLLELERRHYARSSACAEYALPRLRAGEIVYYVDDEDVDDETQELLTRRAFPPVQWWPDDDE